MAEGFMDSLKRSFELNEPAPVLAGRPVLGPVGAWGSSNLGRVMSSVGRRPCIDGGSSRRPS